MKVADQLGNIAVYFYQRLGDLRRMGRRIPNSVDTIDICRTLNEHREIGFATIVSWTAIRIHVLA